MYSDVFHSDFKLKFGLSRSDTCKTCDSLFVKICAEKDKNKIRDLQKESDLHHIRAEAAYSKLKEDQETATVNPKRAALFTDFQQVIFCPILHHSSMFY